MNAAPEDIEEDIEPVTLTPGMLFGPASTKEMYVPLTWYTRDGSDTSHIKSIGNRT